ncbi:hypothetical protein B0H16DRAFT_1449919 [Mycena metata]|uniref:Uncharacterized protein n=1 Tax=Mycena metata TaxID=1033252 RepID=A0AAD7NUA0_9AGAR|nr:hypothetical protein B0H16DRAFT_1449919 [Mycena metata]
MANQDLPDGPSGSTKRAICFHGMPICVGRSDFAKGNWEFKRKMPWTSMALSPSPSGQQMSQRTPSRRASSTPSRQPIFTGTSVLAIKFKDGLVMAADNLASYGPLVRFRDRALWGAIPINLSAQIQSG